MKTKLLYSVIVGGEYFPGVFFKTEKEAVAWIYQYDYEEDEFDVIKLHANYKPARVQLKRTPY